MSPVSGNRIHYSINDPDTNGQASGEKQGLGSILYYTQCKFQVN